MKSTRTTNGVAKKFHSVQQFCVYSLNGGQDTWSYFGSQVNAPEETFKQDFPVMNAIVISLKENAAGIKAKGAAEQRQADQIVAQTNQMVAATNANIAHMQQQQLESDKSFADVDEGIRGYRKVYDTQTGEESDVNLGDVNGVVNALNEADPGRYVQAPLLTGSALTSHGIAVPRSCPSASPSPSKAEGACSLRNSNPTNLNSPALLIEHSLGRSNRGEDRFK